MNLNALTVPMMLNLTGGWLTDEDFATAMADAGPLGNGIFVELGKAHEPLAEVQNKRRKAKRKLKKLIARATKLDALHDRKARALYHHLNGLVEGSDDPAKIEDYQVLSSLLFPNGLRIVNMSYIEESGSALALDRAVDAEARAKLAAIKVGEQTLESLFKAWIDAGRDLGKAVKQRTELEAALAPNGSASAELDLKAGRSQWSRAVRGLLWALETSDELMALAEGVIAEIEQAIAVSQRRINAGGGEDEELDGEDDEDELDDEDEEGDETPQPDAGEADAEPSEAVDEPPPPEPAPETPGG